MRARSGPIAASERPLRSTPRARRHDVGVVVRLTGWHSERRRRLSPFKPFMNLHHVPVSHRAVAAALTVLLHLLVFAALLRVTTRAAEPAPPSAWFEIGAERLRDAGDRLVSVDLVPDLSGGAPLCPGSSYVGVGITADPRTERIVMVGDDTPASRAGLQRDDIVLNPSVWRETREEGTLLRVRVLRKSGQATLVVRVGRICIE